MATLGKFWNGYLFGTNTGKASLTIEGDDADLNAVVRFNDDQLGLAVYVLGGTYSEGVLAMTGRPELEPGQDPAAFGEVTISAALTPEGRLDGEWASTLGTGGTFQFHPHTLNVRSSMSAVPEQLNIVQQSLGAVRLNVGDVRRLIGEVSKDTPTQRPVITYVIDGAEKSLYSDEFDKILDDIPRIAYLKITSQEHELYGINRLVQVELSRHGDNTVRVQSVQEAWALGKAQALVNQLRWHQSGLVTQFRKFGLSVNVAVTGVALALLPGLDGFWRRFAFFAAVFLIQGAIQQLHRRYVPNFALVTDRPDARGWTKLWPTAASWAMAIVGAVVAAIIYGALKGELANSPLFEAVHRVLPN